ncbi:MULTISPECIES: bifunctional protein tyrosine phosphatase family protein/NAD(P)/FAD-dependent oxidoreductase [Acinetobacter]|jgi:sulfide:quinone oxidoreductase|uniref:TIGR01244 family phosphatase n=2 Tax=Acinetobacter TaxID=469 RepID=A0A365PM05_ACIJU|nr:MULTISPECIES: bifunctional protein tyrosine phosphatase family protein/NAD(P)/FAD-dependent oxidoreductase [Acinetobacter]EOR02269.1 TIGR01244 family protein [Acinetobacter genomosp. 15BJ]ERS01241.1 NAD(FAD)-dependent dehydrogenase [Acinetobacter sp. COS3]MCH7293547.1 bifunctional protein tyrosine phosphatase family protein/NAD(P)/FAD-dependent oxidoreductase [Acinetobacter genomosp. 15BJ]RBA38042.1 TIGR01244 family phosphatase [Acinetobacter junii]RBA38921.1 TIGR01244 family phosphatase [A
MQLKQVNTEFLVSEQITAQDMTTLAEQGIKTIICNRPDGEGADQPNIIEIQQAATQHGITVEYLPVTSGQVTDEQAQAFRMMYQNAEKPLLAFCRTGTRSITLWALSQGREQNLEQTLLTAKTLGYDLQGIVPRVLKQANPQSSTKYTVVIVGAGAAGISVAASLLSRQADLDIAIIDPADIHYYQPGWTMVGGGIFPPAKTARQMRDLIPQKVKWIQQAVAAFDPENKQVILEGCKPLSYEALVICPGLKLNWHGIEGLVETLGKNGVTSNYRYDLAPYTWQLVQNLKKGKAVFTQPPMPIKCAGAPQKAMYLSADHWKKQGLLKDIQIDFFNTGAVLFGVAAYVPALMEYVEQYGINLNFNHQLIKVDGQQKRAWFQVVVGESKSIIATDFDMLHVVPPQQAPDFIRASSLVDAAGWLDVNQHTLQHANPKYPNIFALGDVMNAPNAKTAAAARKQAPIVAVNVLQYLKGSEQFAHYDGYGSCPLTVERGKIVLAEFGYGGKLLPSFPKWFLDGEQPSRMAWLLKEQILPPIYWDGMLKGHEWLVKPKLTRK